MSDNPFKDFINSLDVDEENQTPLSTYGLHDIKVEPWDPEYGVDIGFDFDGFDQTASFTAEALIEFDRWWRELTDLIDDESDEDMSE